MHIPLTWQTTGLGIVSCNISWLSKKLTTRHNLSVHKSGLNKQNENGMLSFDTQEMFTVNTGRTLRLTSWRGLQTGHHPAFHLVPLPHPTYFYKWSRTATQPCLLLMYCLGLLSWYNGRAEELQQRPHGLQSQKYVSVALYRTSLPTPDLVW